MRDNNSTAGTSGHEVSRTPPDDDIQKSTQGLLENYMVSIGSRSSRLRRKYKERIIIIILVVLVVVLFVIMIVVSVLYGVEKNKKVCMSKECIRSAATLLMSMDQSADPCEDFYQYSCGNWPEDHPQSNHYSMDWFTATEEKIENQIRDMLTSMEFLKDDPLPVRQAKDMYEACMNTTQLNALGMQPVVAFMKNVSLPPLPTFLNMTGSYSNHNFDWITTIVKIRHKLAIDVLIGFAILSDINNNTVKRLVIQKPSAPNLLPSFNHYEKVFKVVKQGRNKNAQNDNDSKTQNNSEEHLVLYQSLMSTSLQKVVNDVKNDLKINLAKEEIEKNINCAIKEYITIYKNIFSKPNKTKTDERNQTDYEEKKLYYTVDELQNITDVHMKKSNLTSIPIWKPYLLKIFNNSSTIWNFQQDKIVIWEYELKDILRILTVVRNISTVHLELFVWMETFEHFIPHTTTVLKNLHDFYVKTIGKEKVILSKSISCSNMVSKMMSKAVNYKMYNKTVAKQTLKSVKRMLKNIKTGFENSIMSVSWMDLPAKAASLVKVRNMKDLVGYPEWLFEPGKLESFYEGLVIDSNKHLENFVSVFELKVRSELDSFRKSLKYEWDISPKEVNGYYSVEDNELGSHAYYRVLNYGSVGTVFGHEITHGFDDVGRNFDKDGLISQWWSNKTEEMFENRTQCFVDQYSGFYVPEVDAYLDGKKTLSENIADNGGLKSAYIGYRIEKEPPMTLPGLPHLSEDQLFFLSFGNSFCTTSSRKSLEYDMEDYHSPSRLRVKGTLQNMPEFAKAFKCRKNTTMNLARPRCVIY